MIALVARVGTVLLAAAVMLLGMQGQAHPLPAEHVRHLDGLTQP